MAPNNTSITAALVASAAAFYFAKKKAHPLSSCGAPRGRARVFTLAAVDRTDSPGGATAGPPGRPAAHYLDVAEPAVDIPVAELFAPGSDFVLYAVEDVGGESPYLVFAALPPAERAAVWRDEAFIDRGLRKHLALDTEVAVASLASVEDAVKAARRNLASGAWRVSFVWNTGRCGSTLLHKATTNLGAVSLSEPHWLDQLMYGHGGADPAKLRRALAACVAAEATVARLQGGWRGATQFFLNPKAGPHALVPEAAAAFPTSTHVYVYRACEQVVQSFAGLKFGGGIPAPLRLMWLLGRGPLPTRPELKGVSSWPVAFLATRWVESVAGWADLVAARRAAHGPGDPVGGALNVRFDEFTSEDLALRAAVLREVLAHVGLVAADADDGALAPALAAFEKHSQAGSAMSGPKAKVVQDADLPAIRACVAAGLAATDVVVEGGGANVLLPRSAGAARP